MLRLLILKHVRNWSYHVLEREVRANGCIATSPVWAAARCRTPRRWGAGALAVDQETIRQIHDRIVQIAQQQGVTQGRRMRVDTTVVETNIPYVAG